MTYRELYSTGEDKIQKWLEELKDFMKHDEIDQDDLSKSALIVIDMQNFFLQESSHAYVPSSKDILSNVNQLISLYSECDFPVIFTRYAQNKGEDAGIMGRWWRDTVYDGDPEAELYSEILLPDNAVVIQKNKYDSFAGTDLKEILIEKDINTVLISGVMTHLCCETTARSAFTNDLMVYFVIDANATVNEQLHLSSLKTLANGFAVPCLTTDIINKITNVKKGGSAERA